MGLPRPPLAGLKQGRLSRTLDNNSPPNPGAGPQATSPYPYGTLGAAESDMMPPPPTVLLCMTDMLPPPRAPAPQPTPGVITTSIDEGVEADIMDRESESNEAMAFSAGRFAALQRDPYGIGLLPEYRYTYFDGANLSGASQRQSLSGANSSSSLNTFALGSSLSPFASFDSSLEVDIATSNSGTLCGSATIPMSTYIKGPGLSSLGGVQGMTNIGHSPYLQVMGPGGCLATATASSNPVSATSMTRVTGLVPMPNGGGGRGEASAGEDVLQDRGQTRSPVNFREGRRASDGLVAQGIIAFRQRLRESMRACGMVELRQEHQQLQSLYSSGNLAESSEGEATPPPSSSPPQTMAHPHPHRKLSAPHHGHRQWSLDEQGGGGAVGRRRPLMKRMSLPSESFDIQPHKLLALKQSLYLEQQLDRAGTGAGSEEDVAAGAPSTQLHAPQAPPLPSSSTPPLPYEYTPCSKTLQQQLLSHRLQQKRQVFQKHGHPHQHAPHPHHQDSDLPPPLPLTSQLQQLQIDPNNLPKIDFTSSYPSAVPTQGSSLYSVSQALFGVYSVNSLQQSLGPSAGQHCSPGFLPSTLLPVPASAQQDTHLPALQLSTFTAPPEIPLATHDSCGYNTNDDSHSDDANLKIEDGLVENLATKESGDDSEQIVSASMISTSANTQWQRRPGVFMAVHPFQNASALSVPESKQSNLFLVAPSSGFGIQKTVDNADVGLAGLSAPQCTWIDSRSSFSCNPSGHSAPFNSITTSSSRNTPSEIFSLQGTGISLHPLQGFDSGLGVVDSEGLASQPLEQSSFSNPGLPDHIGTQETAGKEAMKGSNLPEAPQRYSELFEEHMDVS